MTPTKKYADTIALNAGGVFTVPVKEEPEIRMDVEEQYAALVIMADELRSSGMIDSDDWRKMAEEATALYAHAIEGL